MENLRQFNNEIGDMLGASFNHLGNRRKNIIETKALRTGGGMERRSLQCPEGCARASEATLELCPVSCHRTALLNIHFSGHHGARNSATKLPTIKKGKRTDCWKRAFVRFPVKNEFSCTTLLHAVVKANIETLTHRARLARG